MTITQFPTAVQPMAELRPLCSAPVLPLKPYQIEKPWIEGCVVVVKEHLECVLSPKCRSGCVGLCVQCVEIVSPLYPTSRITWGSVLFSPGDSQSVLALQYPEKNFLGGWAQYSASPCGIAQLEYAV